MKLSLRFVLPLMLVLTLFAYVAAPYVDRVMQRWFVRDLDARSALIANTVQDSLLEQLDSGKKEKIYDLFDRLTRDERLFAVALCLEPKSLRIASRAMPKQIQCDELDRWKSNGGNFSPPGLSPLHISIQPIRTPTYPAAELVLAHDMGFITQRSAETRNYLFYAFVILAAIISLITVVIAQLSWRGWMAGVRAILRGEGLLRAPHFNTHGAAASKPDDPAFRPIARDLQRLLRDLESEHQRRDDGQRDWSAETLRAVLHSELRGDDVIVVSNREPYAHRLLEGKLEVQRPASGLVAALEPVMRACSGIWIAHGSGNGDRSAVDANDRVSVPPERPMYSLRRIWLSAEEEQGYYYGFANEGLWPLCHIAHVRPIFRSADWTQYVAVNRKFADAVVAEAKRKDPLVLVQDYHLALLPRMIRDSLPDATIITFWHIPWPNPESFAICPWREEILKGMLGSSILGFHTQFHCNNFVDSVDRIIEARVDREDFTVSLAGKMTAVRRYPISIDWPPSFPALAKSIEQSRADVRALNGLPGEHKICIGVDRLDYTKGILERFLAVERLLELKPEWLGRFSMVQIAAPTRTSIDDYRLHEERVLALMRRINERFFALAPNAPAPIVLKVEHHETDQVYEYLRASDCCFVSSLHDGMNLVAKEYVAAHDDERGVLVLSQFTGAARELPEALIVNPYDTDQCAAALHLALTMTADEQRERMKLMRGLVAEFNVYRWAGRMLLDAAAMRRRNAVLERSNAAPVRSA